MSAQGLDFPTFRVGITPTALLNLVPGAQLSFDMGIRPKTNFSLESGFIFNSSQSAKGFRLRPGIERIFGKEKSVGFSIGIHCNYRFTLEYRNIVRRTRTGQYQEIFYNQRRSTHYVGLCVSTNFVFKISRRWFIELGGGAGLGTYQIVDERPLIENERFEFLQPFFSPNRSINFYPILYPHLNFSYAISNGKSKK